MPIARVGRKKEKEQGPLNFCWLLQTYKEQAQQRTIENETKLQEETIASHVKLTRTKQGSKQNNRAREKATGRSNRLTSQN